MVERLDFIQEALKNGRYTKAVKDASEKSLNNIAKVYEISVDDIKALQDSLKYDKPLPVTYKAPSLPDAKEQ